MTGKTERRGGRETRGCVETSSEVCGDRDDEDGPCGEGGEQGGGERVPSGGTGVLGPCVMC